MAWFKFACWGEEANFLEKEITPVSEPKLPGTQSSAAAKKMEEKKALVKHDGKREQGISGQEDCAKCTPVWEYPALTWGEDPGKEKDPHASSKAQLTSVQYRSLIAAAVFVFWLCVPPPPDGFLWSLVGFSVVCSWPFRFGEKSTTRTEKYLFFCMKLSFWQVWIFGHFLFSLEFFRKCQPVKIINTKTVTLGCCPVISAVTTMRFWWLPCYSLSQLAQ